MSNLSHIQRLKLISAYNVMMLERVEAGWQPYFMTFMFQPIPGNERKRLDRMNDEVCRFYSLLLPRVVKYHNRARYRDILPMLIAAPDLPVPKLHRKHERLIDLNGGLHVQGMMALPPVEKCLLGRGLTVHLHKEADKYIRPDRPLLIADARSMSTPALADYTMKQIKRGRIDYDDILILPKASSEVRKKR